LGPDEIKEQLEYMLILYDELRDDAESMQAYADAVLQLLRRVHRTKDDVRAVARGISSWVSSNLGAVNASLVPQHARAAAASALGGILATVYRYR
jgi:hypothetical protein